MNESHRRVTCSMAILGILLISQRDLSYIESQVAQSEFPHLRHFLPDSQRHPEIVLNDPPTVTPISKKVFELNGVIFPHHDA